MYIYIYTVYMYILLTVPGNGGRSIRGMLGDPVGVDTPGASACVFGCKGFCFPALDRRSVTSEAHADWDCRYLSNLVELT